MALARGAPSKDKLKAGLVGCGGRGTQAVVDLLTGTENVELVAMADVFEDHLEGSLKRLRDPKYNTRARRHHGGARRQAARDDARGAGRPSIAPRIKVDPDHHFVGFDALPEADQLRRRYRHAHHAARLSARCTSKRPSMRSKHVFTEKPIATDPVGVRRFLAAAKKAEEKKLTVMSGAQRHEDRPYRRDGGEDPRRRHRRDRGAERELSERAGDARRRARSQVGRYGMGAPQLVLVHLALRRPDRGAALPRYRLHELGDGRRIR